MAYFTTPPKFNIAPEKWCLGDYFAFGRSCIFQSKMKINISGTSLQTCDTEEGWELRANFTHADTRQICGPHFLMPGNKLASSRIKAAASDSESEAPDGACMRDADGTIHCPPQTRCLPSTWPHVH